MYAKGASPLSPMHITQTISHLFHPQSIDDTNDNIAPISAGDLTTTNNGQVALEYTDAKHLFDYITEYTSRNMRLIKRRRASREEHFERVTAAATKLSGYQRPQFHPRHALSMGKYTGMKGKRADNTVLYEQFVIESESPCVCTVELYTPATPETVSVFQHTDTQDNPKPNGPTKVFPTVVYTSSIIHNGNDEEEDVLENALLVEAIARGQAVAVVSVCGFGKAGYSFMGDIHYAEFRSGKPQLLAQMNGRSIVGLHAADMMRALLFLSTHASVQSIVGLVC
ncbi:hypothetical protein SARC_13895, partial [Sphaeroforma arctica JP610]